jgi:hypothetical protein
VPPTIAAIDAPTFTCAQAVADTVITGGTSLQCRPIKHPSIDVPTKAEPSHDPGRTEESRRPRGHRHVVEGEIVGVGTGSTANCFIDELA